jgi:predicted nucleic-acid-binding Zn-ribbon protein
MTVTNNATHVLRHYRSKGATQLYRRANKMVIAVRDGMRVAWGEDPKMQQGRAFVDEDACIRFLRQIADIDQKSRKGIVCKSCGYAPMEMIVCDVSNDGSHSIDYEASARIEEEDAGRAALVQ